MSRLIFLVIFALVAQGQAQRECFVCNDCRELPGNIERTICEPPVPTLAPPTTVTFTPPSLPPTTSLTPAFTTTDPSTGPTLTPPILPGQPQPVASVPEQKPGAGPNLTLPVLPNEDNELAQPEPVAPVPEQKSHIRRRRQVQDPWQCFEIDARIGEVDVYNRGCVQRAVSDALTCVAAGNGVAPTHCRLCDYDGCNSASSLSISLVALAMSILMILKL